MPPGDWHLRVEDILEAVDGACRYDDFLRDRRTVDAVVRKLTIIGEAAVHVPDAICERSPDVPWVDMRAMRNFVVHAYFGVSEKIVWDTVRNDLPGIVEPLNRLLSSVNDGPAPSAKT